MDIDIMKSDAENQMEMMLMQMDKLPDFCSAYSDHNTNNIPMLEFLQTHQNHFNSISTDSNSNDTIFDEHSSPLFMNNTISFDPSSFMQGSSQSSSAQKRNSMAAMREMIFRIAAMQPIHIDPETVKPPKRRNVKISTDPQSVAARHRRERISERIRILQRLVPGGTKMDTASMLDEAIHYVKFLKNQVQSLERVAANRPAGVTGVGFPVPSGSYYPISGKGYHHEGDD